MTWVWRDGKLTEKTAEAHPARSSVPCPMIIRDGLSEPLKHMANGQMYDSKRAFSKATRDAGCVELGNEMPKPMDSSPLAPITKADVAEAYNKVRDGYKPAPPIMRGVPKDSGWT